MCVLVGFNLWFHFVICRSSSKGERKGLCSLYSWYKQVIIILYLNLLAVFLTLPFILLLTLIQWALFMLSLKKLSLKCWETREFSLKSVIGWDGHVFL